MGHPHRALDHAISNCPVVADLPGVDPGQRGARGHL